ncbi:MAG: type II secretion system major pseudopilin GspG [Planctomycetes bacterium]|nr:type II secretion system major pseudopilin GspG [Planctomycetota bacterium]
MNLEHGARARRRREAAFTLVELMVVVIVLAILAATILPQFVGVTHDAKVARARSDISVLAQQLEAFKLRHDRYPTTEEGLQALVDPPAGELKGWRPLIKELMLDPWGNPYQYRARLDRNGFPTFDVWSRGADGQDGGEGEDRDIYPGQEPSER